MSQPDNLESQIPRRRLFTVRCVVILLLPLLLLWSVLIVTVFALRLFIVLWHTSVTIALGLTPEPPDVIPDWVFVPQAIFYKGWRHAFLSDDELRSRYGQPQVAGPRSISDDDLCSACQRCKGAPSGVDDLAYCAEGWPGQPDPAAYITACKLFKPRN